MIGKNIKGKFFKALIILFVLMNIIAFFHAYKFTHFSTDKQERTKSPEKLLLKDKIKTLFFGVNNPKPTETQIPTQDYTTVKLQSIKKLECWHIKREEAKGTVIIFHGYGGEKSSMLDKSDEFIKMGLNTLLVDFMGCGNSEGDQTTIGYKEAMDVQVVFDYLKQSGEKDIYLFGTSMGAVAIMRAISEYSIRPKGIIIECPFGSMYETVCARFHNMHVPTFPMAGLLVFWGSVQNGFWGFGHNPTEYAGHIKCPTLLLYGEKDKNVSRKEIDDIYANLRGLKQLNTYPLAGHENYLTDYKEEWILDVNNFLKRID